MVALYVLGEAFEATNLHAYLARSSDGGRTWQHQGRICPDLSGRLTTECGRLSVTAEGELVAVLVRADFHRYVSTRTTLIDQLQAEYFCSVQFKSEDQRPVLLHPELSFSIPGDHLPVVITNDRLAVGE